MYVLTKIKIILIITKQFDVCIVGARSLIHLKYYE